jgi:xylulokinase
VYARTYKFLNVLDYMNLRLTGRFAATFDSILTSWVTDNRDPDDIHYDSGLVRASGIDAEKLPEIVPCTAVLGRLKADVAEALGLATDVQVVAGSIDNTAAAIGAGAVEDFMPHLYIGTSSWMAAHVPFKKTDPLASLASVPCAMPKRYLLTALQATAGGNLTFLRDNILYHKDELLREENVPDVFKIMDRIVARVPAGSNGVIYTPWIWGERAPVDDRTLRAGLHNLSLHNTREDIIRAFFEGIAFNTRWLVQPFERFIGRQVKRINLVGGGGNSDVWCQIFADVMNVEIYQVQDSIQANARGAAWIAAVGLGEITFSDVPGLVEFKHTYTPTAENRATYDDRFAAFTQIYRQMKGLYNRLNGK